MYNKKQNYRWASGNNDESLSRGVAYDYEVWNQTCKRDISVPFRIDCDYDFHPGKEVEEKFGRTFWKFYTSQSGSIALGSEDVLHTIDAFIEVLKDMRATVSNNPNPKFEYQDYLENKLEEVS